MNVNLRFGVLAIGIEVLVTFVTMLTRFRVDFPNIAKVHIKIK